MTSLELRQSQGLPLELKIIKSKQRIREWYDHWRGQVHVSFSGGKDSTVLLHLTRQIFPNIPAVFCDTGLEYPEIRDFVKTHENVEIIRPTISFREVIEKYGYPVVSKEISRFIYEIRTSKSERLRDIRLNGPFLPDGRRGHFGKLSNKWKYLINAPFKISHQCCDFLKKKPFINYERQTGQMAMTGEMAIESRRRTTNYLMNEGCNGFAGKRPRSTPLGFWTNQDILRYLKELSVPYSSIYGDIAESDSGFYTTGAERTGCLFCMFGVHLDRGINRFMRMQETHSKLWDYCIHKLGCGRVLSYMGIPYSGMIFDKEETA